MSESSKYNSFTVADIERYHNGQMSAAERHALEKAALDDPFLADALEGYAFTSTPAADVDAIKKRLEAAQKKRKVVPFVSKTYKWLQIAALFVILAGSGWVLYKTGFLGKKEIAQAMSAKPEQAKAPINPSSSDSISRTATPLPPASPPKALEKTVVLRKKNKPVFRPTLSQTKEDRQPTAAADVAIAAEPPKELPESANLPRRMALNDSGAAANISLAAKNKIAAAAANAPDSTKQSSAYVMLRGKTLPPPAANDTIKLNVIMQPSRDNLNEVVVVHMGGKTKAAPQPAAKFEELEPTEGWSHFNDYIAQNLKQPRELKEKTISGEVELSFDVDKEGQAVNIKVEKSLCEHCDKEAVRLLKEGPRWKKKKNKKGKITIHF